MSLLLRDNHEFEIQEGSKCTVRIPFYVGLNGISNTYRYANIAIFASTVIYVLVTLCWMWYRLDTPFLRKHGDFTLISLSGLGGLLFSGALLRESLGRESSSCIFFLWAATLVFPLYVSPILARLLRFYNKALFYEHMKETTFEVYIASRDDVRNLRNLRLAVTDPGSFLVALQALNLQNLIVGRGSSIQILRKSGNNNNNHTRPRSLGLSPAQKKRAMRGRESLAAISVESVDSGFYCSEAYVNLVVLLSHLPFIIYSIVVMATSRVYGNPVCFGCELTLLELILPAIYSLITLILVTQMFFRVYNAPDPFLILREIVLVALVVVVGGALTMILFLTDPGKIAQKGFFTWNYIMVVVAFISHTMQCTIPIIQSYRIVNVKLGSSPESAFKSILQNPTGLSLFQEHMAAEFNVESLRMYLEVNKWRDLFQTNPDLVGKTAYEIYRTFVERGSYMECNVSDEQRSHVEKAIYECQERNWINTPISLFDEMQKELFKLMLTDSFPRFITSKAYLKWQKTAGPIIRRPSKEPAALGGSSPLRQNSKSDAATTPYVLGIHRASFVDSSSPSPSPKAKKSGSTKIKRWPSSASFTGLSSPERKLTSNGSLKELKSPESKLSVISFADLSPSNDSPTKNTIVSRETSTSSYEVLSLSPQRDQFVSKTPSFDEELAEPKILDIANAAVEAIPRPKTLPGKKGLNRPHELPEI